MDAIGDSGLTRDAKQGGAGVAAPIFQRMRFDDQMVMGRRPRRKPGDHRRQKRGTVGKA